MKKNVRITALAVSLAGAVGLGACGQSLGATTTCAAYQGLSSSDKDKAIVAMHAAHNDNGSVLVGRASVAAYCLLHDGSAQIQGVYGG